MRLNEISQGYFKLFINNPKRLDLFLMYSQTAKLNENILKQEELDKTQTDELSV